MYGDEWPLRVTGIASAAESEWRIGQQTPERTCEGWLLVYVKSGMVEELCDTHRVLLRAGQILFHQPAELFAMRAVGEVPPEVFRVEFTADGSAMDSFRSCHMRLGNAEKSCLRQLAETVREVFQPVQDACQMPARRAEIPFGGKELQTIYLAQLLYLLARRRQRTRKQSPRARAEQEQAALVESVRLYFAQNIEKPLAQYVLNTWPDAIMYYTYNSDNGISYDHIEKTLCPLTAYRLGLVDSFPGSEQFPAATQDPPGVFSNGAGQNWTASDEATWTGEVKACMGMNGRCG